MYWLRQLRLYDMVKNGFVFLPLFFAGKLADPVLLQQAIAGFLAFCFAAMAVYAFNDWVDVKQDRAHPEKQHRPFAAGRITTTQLWIAIALCLVLASICAWWLPLAARWVLVAYLALQLAYSLALKHLAIIDCVCIALGFVLRVVLGSLILGFAGSQWILMVTFLLSLYLAFAKRYSEMGNQNHAATRQSLQQYSPQFLRMALTATHTSALVAYIMYTVDPLVVQRLHSPYLFVGGIFVLVGMLRHLQQTVHHQNTESPATFLLKDLVVLGSVVAWVIFNAVVLYWAI